MVAAKTDGPKLNQSKTSNEVAVDQGAREQALSLLLQAAESSDALLRANAIEALQAAPDRVAPVVQRGLGDENRGVRFAAAMTVGKLRLTDLADLLEPLTHDRSQSVQAAAIYGLRRCGRQADLNPLGRMLESEDPEVKGNAAFVLGELGDPSAIPVLRAAMGKGVGQAAPIRRRVVELQLAEALVKLGAHAEIDAIRAAIFAPAEEAELSILACQMCGGLRDSGAVADLVNIVQRVGSWERPPEMRMAAALAAAQIDPTESVLKQRDPDASMMTVPVRYIDDPRPAVRAQASHALGGIMAALARANHMGQHAGEGVFQLRRLITDPSPLVQVSAAGGILRVSA
jgi:HEAT repeat protein